MTQLSRGAILGIGKETTPGTYVVPTAYIPWQKADFEDKYGAIKDTSMRANDTELQGVYQGPLDVDWSIDMLAYPDVAPYFFRSVIGPDTVAAGVSTALQSDTTVGATSISTALSIPVGSTIRIQDAGGTKTEYAVTGTPTGSGPYTIPITTPAGGLTLTHTAAGGSVTSLSTHTFKQNIAVTPASYSLTVFDTLTNIGYPGAKLSDLGIKIDPKGAVQLTSKWASLGQVSATSMTPAFTAFDPELGWSWQMTNGGAASTRGLSYDVTVKRALDSIHSSDGIQGPREIFTGALSAEGSYKAIFENQLDLALYMQNSQQAASAVLAQPLAKGGQALTITMSKSGWSKGKRDFGGSYVQADFTLDGIYNTTDGGAIQVVLTNYVSTQY